MKLIASLLSACLLAACGSTVTYEMPGEEQAMAMMMEAGAPGPRHALLQTLAGTWDVDMTSYMGPDGPAVPMAATAVFTPAMDGRMVTEDFEGDFEGMSFRGRLVMGFDNVTGRWWTVWFDNMSTGAMHATGAPTSDDAVVTEGLIHDLITPAGRPTRTSLAGLGSDTLRFTMWDTGPDGQLYVVMEGVYTRRA